MDFKIISKKEFAAVECDVLLVGVFQNEPFALPKSFKQLPSAFEKQLILAATREEFTGKKNQNCVLPTLGTLAQTFVGLTGLGEKKLLELETLRRSAAQAYQMANGRKLSSFALMIPKNTLPGKEQAAALMEGALLASYHFTKYKTEDKSASLLKNVTFILEDTPVPSSQKIIQETSALCQSVFATRDLINECPGVMNPKEMALQAQKLAKGKKLEVTVFGEKELEKEKMGLLLAVSQAALKHAPPRVIKLAYRPSKKVHKHIVLIGKGVTFDTGGLDIKPPDGMLDMKLDMSGAAAVLGTLLTVAEIAPPHTAVTGYLGCVENAIGPDAYHPSDVITSRKGLTVEVNNTDAEGRLVLADLMHYAQEKDQPHVLIDVATLTGASMIALGNSTAALFSNNEELSNALRASGKNCGEDFWPMPLNDELSEQLKSNIADLKNTGARYGSCITAALFLKRFVESDIQWAHLDIAGPAMAEKEHPYIPKGGAGFAVRTLVDFIKKS